jgi:hypothetical protein
MADKYAKKLASKLIKDDEDRVTVEVPNHGFSDEVSQELEKLGFDVVRDEFRPGRITIVRKK